MESAIEKLLTCPEINTQEELRRFVADVQSKITIFEKQIYERGDADPAVLKRIRSWRTKLLEIIKNNKELPEQEDPEEKAGMQTLKLLNRQIDFADTNQRILDKSSLKLVSLDISSDQLDKAMVETRKKLENGLKTEDMEYRRLVIAFIIYIIICIGILIDKLTRI